MAATEKTYRLFLSVNDPSADAHCAGLIAALKRTDVPIAFVGIGGPKMAAAGCDLIQNTVGRAVMTYGALAHLGHFYKLIRRAGRYLREQPVDLVIVCDSPSFNFHIARAARKAGTPTLFYVAPQLWAWGGWRIRKLRRLCDKLCCILPFEQEWFRQRRVDAVFVGNPLLETLPGDMTSFRKDYSRFHAGQARIALMPGSRMPEIDTLWQPMQEIALELKRKYPDMTFVAVANSEQRRQLLRDRQLVDLACEYTVDAVRDMADLADFCIVASGSATLEVASAGCPMAILYQTNRFLWHLIGRWLVRAKFLALVNLLAARELVPEFMPYFTATDPVTRKIDSLLQDPRLLERTSHELIDLVEPMTEKEAGAEVARIAVEMLRRT